MDDQAVLKEISRRVMRVRVVHESFAYASGDAKRDAARDLATEAFELFRTIEEEYLGEAR